MKEKVLIVEDQFVEADYLRLMLTKAGYQVCDIARSVVQARELIEKENPDILLLDIFLKGSLTGIDLAKELQEKNIPFVFLSANSNEDVLMAAKATQPYGFLIKPFREKDLLITLEIARYRHRHSKESMVLQEKKLLQQLIQITKENTNWEEKLLSIAKTIQPYIPFDYFGAGLNQIGALSCNTISFLRTGFDEYQTIGVKELLLITKQTMPDILKKMQASWGEDKATIYNEPELIESMKSHAMKNLIVTTFNMESHLSLPLFLSNGELFTVCLYSRRPDAYKPEHLALVNHLEQTWTNSVEKMLDKENKNRAATSSITGFAGYNINTRNFSGIIGSSHLLLNVFDLITQVAPSDTSVLVMGESGTGKERIADSIHQLSPRKDNPLIKINCAALPPSLIESELFGHEKGSFTGALEKRIGKFEQADKGTIFLDEIGELPLELQVKLLRVLQEKEVERIGAKTTIKINVRIITATNRNLEKEVAEGRFRLDLYYRLNVFPIVLPALRDRKEDIPLLTDHFIHYYNRKSGKKVTGIADGVLQKLIAYNWPGNIRQLEHLIERSVLLAKGYTIEDIALPEYASQPTAATGEVYMKTIHENERDHIMAVLKNCHGRIWGAGGAAEILNIPPSTLKSKMKKLGIKKEWQGA